MPDSILLTGGAGFIGSHIAVEVARAGHRPVLLDNLCNSKGSVIHLAGLKAVGESVERPLAYYDNNVVGTLRLLEAMNDCGVRSIVFSSSCTVYGDPQRLPLTESHPLSATNPYGQSKLTIELMLRDLARSDDRADKVNALADSQPLCLRTKGRGIAWDRHIALATAAVACAGDLRRVLRGGMVAVRCAWCARSATEMGVAAAGGGCGCAARGARRKHRLVYQRRRCPCQVVHCGADRVCCSDVADRTRRHRRRGTRLPRAAQVDSLVVRRVVLGLPGAPAAVSRGRDTDAGLGSAGTGEDGGGDCDHHDPQRTVIRCRARGCGAVGGLRRLSLEVSSDC